MYFRVKERNNQYDEQILYFYICQSVRIKGKVTNAQKYLMSCNKRELQSGNYEEKLKAGAYSLEPTVNQMVAKKIAEILEHPKHD